MPSSLQDITGHGRGLAPGDVVGEKFRIGQMIGRGGMSVVYEARHIHLGQSVAVKVLSGVQTATRAVFERVLVEAQATARLTSEHVVRVIDVGMTAQGQGYVVMEKLVGHDLADELKAGAQFTVAEAVKLVLEACHGIAEAHAAGIVHRDIKPSNLFLSQKPDKTVTLKVLDFGLAQGQTTTATTARGSAKGPRIAGSPGYASPEQLGTAGEADARADVWGLGIVLYELVSGHRPFEATNLAEALVAAATLPMPPLTSARGEPIPDGFEAVIRKCLEKDREDRYATIPDLADALGPFAPASFAHYVDRIKAVGGSSGFSVGTIRTAAYDPQTATMGTFATDTFTQEPSSIGPPPSSLASPSNPDPPTQQGQGLVTAAIVPQRALLLAALLVVSVLGVVYIVMTKRRPTPIAAMPAPSALVTTPPSALGPLGPLAPLAPLDAGATVATTAPQALPTPVAEPAPSIDTIELPDRDPGGPLPNPKKKKTPKTPAPKPSGNPMGYR